MVWVRREDFALSPSQWLRNPLETLAKGLFISFWKKHVYLIPDIKHSNGSK